MRPRILRRVCQKARDERSCDLTVQLHRLDRERLDQLQGLHQLNLSRFVQNESPARGAYFLSQRIPAGKDQSHEPQKAYREDTPLCAS